ncbi:MAG: hypothetical protein ABSH28_05380 [Acidobacteriota bacterium]
MIAIALTLIFLKTLALNRHGAAATREVQPTDTPVDFSRAVYADDPADPWNRIFHSLFTRTVKIRMSDNFSEAAPFMRLQVIAHQNLQVSTRTFARLENGDRAIEPLYPSFLNDAGVAEALTEPGFSEFKQALTEALDEKIFRLPLARALMQSDAWAAYDMLFARKTLSGANARLLSERRDQLLLLLARFIRKLALRPEEIQSLRDNYSDAAASLNLPGFWGRTVSGSKSGGFPGARTITQSTIGAPRESFSILG